METLLGVLQFFRLPDVDVCVSEEVPQVLVGRLLQREREREGERVRERERERERE